MVVVVVVDVVVVVVVVDDAAAVVVVRFLSDGETVVGKHLVFAVNACTTILLPLFPVDPVRGQSVHIEVTDPAAYPCVPRSAVCVNESFE